MLSGSDFRISLGAVNRYRAETISVAFAHAGTSGEVLFVDVWAFIDLRNSDDKTVDTHSAMVDIICRYLLPNESDDVRSFIRENAPRIAYEGYAEGKIGKAKLIVQRLPTEMRYRVILDTDEYR